MYTAAAAPTTLPVAPVELVPLRAFAAAFAFVACSSPRAASSPTAYSVSCAARSSATTTAISERGACAWVEVDEPEAWCVASRAFAIHTTDRLLAHLGAPGS